MRKTKQRLKQLTASYASVFMEPIIAGVRSRPRGAVARLVEEMNRVAPGARFTRQDVQGWIMLDPAERVEPRIGAAMILKAAYEKMTRDELGAQKAGSHD